MKPAGTCCLYDGSHIIWLLQSRNAAFRSKLTIFVLYNLETWWMTLTNNRAPPLHHFKLCASFNSRQWIQTRVTVRKRPNWGKICFDLCDLDLWPQTLTFCMNITFVNGNYSWKFYDTMTGTLWKWCHKGMSISVNKPTTRYKSGWVSLVSSSCLYKTQPERALVQVCHTRTEVFSELFGRS